VPQLGLVALAPASLQLASEGSAAQRQEDSEQQLAVLVVSVHPLEQQQLRGLAVLVQPQVLQPVGSEGSVPSQPPQQVSAGSELQHREVLAGLVHLLPQRLVASAALAQSLQLVASVASVHQLAVASVASVASGQSLHPAVALEASAQAREVLEEWGCNNQCRATWAWAWARLTPQHRGR
jgi:hypothetical protein